MVVKNLVAAICLGSPAMAGDVVVNVDGLRNLNGDLRVAICEEESFLEPSCATGGRAPARERSVRVRDVAPGVYAVQAHHDENTNGRIDRSVLGRPEEGIGFSRDAWMRFGPPSFGDAAVRVPEGGGTVNVTMRYVR